MHETLKLVLSNSYCGKAFNSSASPAPTPTLPHPTAPPPATVAALTRGACPWFLNVFFPQLIKFACKLSENILAQIKTAFIMRSLKSNNSEEDKKQWIMECNRSGDTL